MCIRDRSTWGQHTIFRTSNQKQMRTIIVCLFAIVAIAAAGSLRAAKHNDIILMARGPNRNLTSDCLRPYDSIIDTLVNLDFDKPVNWANVLLSLVANGQEVYAKCSARAFEVNSTLAQDTNTTAACSTAAELVVSSIYDSFVEFSNFAAYNTAEYVARAFGAFVFAQGKCTTVQYNWEELARKVLQRYSVKAECAAVIGILARDAQSIANNFSNPNLVVQLALEVAQIIEDPQTAQYCGFQIIVGVLAMR
eukprot:TRINITY_DN2031_c0_g1_i2.p2 TRINITY_DN2031_c0_g1~~TRINITY_DN2031_c0_g1_i2.p2  ORF type:complete len:251 (+),score=112.78 TRINITY_DN2031_c0_g1_i2:66-818(+)